MDDGAEPQPHWLESLDLMLSSSAGRDNALSPLELLDDIDGWLSAVRSSRQWTLNRRSLADDLETTCKLVGARLRKTIGRLLPVARKSFRDLVALDTPTREQQLSVRELFSKFRGTLSSDTALLAAWSDLLDELQNPAGTLRRAEQLTVVLGSCLELRGADSKSIFSTLRRSFGASPTGPNRSSVDPADPDRLEPVASLSAAAAATLLSVPAAMHCVVWLQYEFAELREALVEAGDVTFFSAPWALEAARRDGAPDFAHRDELRTVLDEIEGLGGGEEFGQTRSLVIARVDLGIRMTRDAITAGDEIVQLLISVATMDSGGIRWRRTGTALLAVDGQGFGLEMRATSHEPTPTPYGMEITAEELSTRAVEVGVTMSHRPLPAEIIEAIRQVSEAGLERSYESAFGYSKNLHARTSVAQRNHAFEHVAAWGGYGERELEEEITVSWASSSWQHEMGATIDWIIRRTWDSPSVQALDAILRRGGHGRPLLFSIAYEHAEELIDLLPARIQRQRLSWLMKGIGDAPHYLRIERAYGKEHEIGLARLRRVRNALVHGNPITPAIVQSVTDLAIRRSNHGLRLAVDAFNQDLSLNELLRIDRTSFRAKHGILEKGGTWLNIWSTAPPT
jgi:hypothetical protein